MKKKIIDIVFSTKVFTIVIATVFLYIGKLSENAWMETVLIIGGLRTASQIMDKHIESKK